MIEIGEEQPYIHLAVTMTPEDYVEIKKKADWEGQSVSRYLVDLSSRTT